MYDKYDFAQAALKFGAGAVAAYSGVRSGSGTVSRKRRRVEMPSSGVMYKKYRKRMGRRYRRSASKVFKHLVGSGSPYIIRWASMSDSLKGPGRLPMWLASATEENNFAQIPIYFMSLTALAVENPGGSGDMYDSTGYGAYNKGLCKIHYDSTAGTFTYRSLFSQGSSGNTAVAPATTYADPYWKDEVVSYPSTALRNKVFHKYTDIRLNLYGCGLYPLTYTLYVLKMPKSWSMLSHAEGAVLGTNSEASEMLRDMVRPLVANPINSNGPSEWLKHVRVVKKMKYFVPPLGYTDYEVAKEAGTTLPVKLSNCKQVKLFMRHDRYRDYNWAVRTQQREYDLDLTNLGWDKTVESDCVPDVDWDSRLYMYITCNVAGRTVNSIAAVPERNPSVPQTAIPADYGTFDIQVRQAFVSFDQI